MTTPRRNAVDLHTHTARSDGLLEPLELYEQMRAWGSTLVAITDHDTLAGVREMLAAGCGATGTSGPRLIVGVEINTLVDRDIEAVGGTEERLSELHILGLGVDPDDAALAETLERQRDAREVRLQRTLGLLRERGMPVDDHLPAVAGGIESLGRPHVARALVSAGYAQDVQDAFERYLVPGRPAYVRRGGIGPRAAIEAIITAGGVASLAHAPWAPQEPAVIDELVRWGLGALEVHYHHWDEERVEGMGHFADERGLLRTGGSDYHGDTGTYAQAQAGVYVPRRVGERLLRALGAA
ncbi:MAG: PHP domain-containing protein [Candidatus Limnocylindrales bacterium]